MDDARWADSGKTLTTREKRALGNHKRGPCKESAIPFGKKFGKLTVIAIAPYSRPSGEPSGWHPIVRCDCGTIYQLIKGNLLSGGTRKCVNCGNKDRGFKHIIANKKDRLRLLGRISSQEKRCYDRENKNYSSYGGLGITVYGPWREDHGLYLRYLITLPGWDDPNLELDRINSAQGYKPGNLRFSTKLANQRNRRSLSQLIREKREIEFAAMDVLRKLQDSTRKLELSRRTNREKDRQIEDLLAVIYDHGIDLV
jgi:hypothetical protein